MKPCVADRRLLRDGDRHSTNYMKGADPPALTTLPQLKSIQQKMMEVLWYIIVCRGEVEVPFHCATRTVHYALALRMVSAIAQPLPLNAP